MLLKFRFVIWDVLTCKIIVDLSFRGTCCLHHQRDYFTRQYIPEDKSELHTRRRESFKSHNWCSVFKYHDVVVKIKSRVAQLVSGYRLEDRATWGSIPGRGEMIFPLASVSRPALWPTQPPVQLVPGVLSSGIKRGRSVTLTENEYKLSLLSPQAPSWRVVGQL
jgi:hypothetical protein